jgi:hypothetical protein
MKKISGGLSLFSILGIIGMFFYTKTNLSLIIPLIPVFIALKSIFLLGILLLISTYFETNTIKKVSIGLFLIGATFATLGTANIFPISSIQINIIIVITSFILMLSQTQSGILKIGILSMIIFPILLILGLNSNVISYLGLGMVVILGILSLFQTSKN